MEIFIKSNAKLDLRFYLTLTFCPLFENNIIFKNCNNHWFIKMHVIILIHSNVTNQV